MNDWKEYTNSDEQIAEMQDCKYGFILLYKDKKQYEILTAHWCELPLDPPSV